MDLLLITDENNKHQRLYVSKILTDLFVIRQKIRIKNTFADIAYVLEVKRSCKNEHKKVCLKKNGNQGIKLRNSSINFKKLFQAISCAI